MSEEVPTPLLLPKLVRVLPVAAIKSLRFGEGSSLLSFNKQRDSYEAPVEAYTIKDERVGCRCCGAPLNQGVNTFRAVMFTGFEGKHKPDVYVYVHAEDCWTDGFVQTVSYNGKFGNLLIMERKYHQDYNALEAAQSVGVVLVTLDLSRMALRGDIGRYSSSSAVVIELGEKHYTYMPNHETLLRYQLDVSRAKTKARKLAAFAAREGEYHKQQTRTRIRDLSGDEDGPSDD